MTAPAPAAPPFPPHPEPASPASPAPPLTASGKGGRRFPYQPLAQLGAAALGLPYCRGSVLDGAGRRVVCPGCLAQEHAGPAALARWMGVSDSATLRWIDLGIPEDTADRVCAHVGLHPDLVPGWDWYGEIDATFDDPWITQGSLFGWSADGAGDAGTLVG